MQEFSNTQIAFGALFFVVIGIVLCWFMLSLVYENRIKRMQDMINRKNKLISELDVKRSEALDDLLRRPALAQEVVYKSDAESLIALTASKER